MTFFKEMKINQGIDARHIQWNHADENQSLERLYRQKGLSITLEYTTQGKPQLKEMIERKFAML